MSMRNNLSIIIIGTIIFNILILFAGYSLLTSANIFGDFNTLCENFDMEVSQIAKSINESQDYQDVINKRSQGGNLIFRLEDLDGKIIYDRNSHKLDFFYINSVKPVKISDDIYLLKVIKPLEKDEILELPSMRNLFYIILIITVIILVSLFLILYYRFVRPIESFQKAVADYKGHLNVKRTRRFDEIGKLQNSFVQLAEKLEEEKAKQYRIIASISHDIKTPLTSVMGYAEQFKKGNLSAERTEKYLNIIYLKSLAIKDLLEEFDEYLSFSQRSTLRKQEITVNDFMRAIRNDYEDELSHMGIIFKTENFCPDLVIQVDVSKMRRVFGNIIANSLKHFSKNEKEIVISCNKRNNTAVFSISDNGTGVEDELLTQIFEPMYTSDEGRSVAGLGLAICKEIILTHGGDIWAENNKSGGLTVSFYIPIEKK
jgi:signal transduction histidine kinase